MIDELGYLPLERASAHVFFQLVTRRYERGSILLSNAGHFKMGAQHYFISHALKGDNIGLEAIDDGLWNILYYNTLLGRLSERTGKISGASFRSDEC